MRNLYVAITLALSALRGSYLDNRSATSCSGSPRSSCRFCELWKSKCAAKRAASLLLLIRASYERHHDVTRPDRPMTSPRDVTDGGARGTRCSSARGHVNSRRRQHCLHSAHRSCEFASECLQLRNYDFASIGACHFVTGTRTHPGHSDPKKDGNVVNSKASDVTNKWGVRDATKNANRVALQKPDEECHILNCDAFT